jgi:hypothetical protein
MPMTPREVLGRRRAERVSRLDAARRYVDGLPATLTVRGAVVVGSVARGDFHDASDIDVVVVADGLAESPPARWRQVAARQGRVRPVAWTPGEWALARQRRNPLVQDALDHGVWLVGGPADFGR